MTYFDDFSVMSQIRYVVPFRHAGVFFFSSVQFTKLAEKWEGCINQGSRRVRCPKGTHPCNSRVNNGKEFSCFEDCSENGGRKECSDDGTDRKII